MDNQIRALIIAAAIALFAPISASAQAVQVPPGEVCFQATTGINGQIGVLGTITAGSGGAPGTYVNVALTGGSGTGATANITVSNGGVTQVVILNPGINYVVSDALSTSSSLIGNTTGFSVVVNSISINSSLAGGSVGMYLPGTLTYSQTWQDAGQTTQNANPISLDANGCATIYGIGTYRQILYDNLGNQVWDKLTSVAPINPFWAGTATGTADAITLTDTSFAGVSGQQIQFIAAFTNTSAVTINPSSFGAIPVEKNTNEGPQPLSGGEIVAGNLITVTYNSTANAFFLSATPYVVPVITNAIPSAGGRLTLVSGSPVMTSTTTGQSTIYYAPYTSQFVPIYNGTQLVNYQFTASSSDTVGQSLALGSSWAGNTVFDVYDTLVAGTPTLCTVQWTSTTARNVNLANYDGVMTNATSATCQNSNGTSITIAANQGTYLGSFYTDSSAGQVSFNLGGSANGGVAGFIDIWNFYNRVDAIAITEDNSGSYGYQTAAWRQANSSSGNQVNFIIGVAGEKAQAIYSAGYLSNAHSCSESIGLNSITTSTNSAETTQVGNNGTNFEDQLTGATYQVAPIGLSYFSRNEFGNTNCTWDVNSNDTLSVTLQY